MKPIYRGIANATTFAIVALFLLLPLIFMVAPKAAAAVIGNLFRLELENPFWSGGGAVFLGGGILWLGGILLATGGGTLLFEGLVRGLAHRPDGKASFNELSTAVERREGPELILKPRPISAGSPIGQIVNPQQVDGGAGASLSR